MQLELKGIAYLILGACQISVPASGIVEVCALTLHSRLLRWSTLGPPGLQELEHLDVKLDVNLDAEVSRLIKVDQG